MRPSASLIIVSQNRPDDLCELIKILKVQQGIVFELILVTNTPIDLIKLALGDRPATYIYSETPNISYLRNLGLKQAKSTAVAFCDDDAIPEPSWLNELVQPLSDPSVGSVAGPVLGRNGFDIQWGVVWTDNEGLDVANDALPDKTTLYPPKQDRFMRPQGTNCAFRLSDMQAIGGFDEGFSYFLDETDVAKRLADQGKDTAFVPTARVQHLYRRNRSRNPNRSPKSMVDIAQSIRRFAEKHTRNPARAVQRHIKGQRARLRRSFELGQLEPQEYKRMVDELASNSVSKTNFSAKEPEQLGTGVFCQNTDPREAVLIASTLLTRDAARKAADEALRLGKIVTLANLSFTNLRHSRHIENGFYVQTGGVWGVQIRKPQNRGTGLRSCLKLIFKDLSEMRKISQVEWFHPLGGQYSQRDL